MPILTGIVVVSLGERVGFGVEGAVLIDALGPQRGAQKNFVQSCRR